MLKCLLILVLVAAAVYSSPVTKPAWKKPDFCQSFECPRFKLIRDAGAYQVRRYEEAWWVGANATSRGLFSNAGLFFKLFRYMFGNNERGTNMGMTVPVAMRVSFGTTNRTMSFHIPSAHQNNPPNPIHLLSWRSDQLSPCLSESEPCQCKVRKHISSFPRHPLANCEPRKVVDWAMLIFPGNKGAVGGACMKHLSYEESESGVFAVTGWVYPIFQSWGFSNRDKIHAAWREENGWISGYQGPKAKFV